MPTRKEIKTTNTTKTLIKEVNEFNGLFNFLTSGIIVEISKFIGTLTDFLNFIICCKVCYKTLMKNNIILNNLFKNIKIKILNQDLIPTQLCIILNSLNFCKQPNLVSYAFLKYFLKLKSLNLQNCNIGDNDLLNLEKLEELNLRNCKNISGICFKNLINLKKLNYNNYSLKNYYLNKPNENYLNNLINLKYLNINYFEYKFESDFNFIKNLKKLKTLHALELPIKDEHLQNLQNLKELLINSKSLVTGKSLQNLQNLTILNINTTKLEDEDLQNLQNLKELNISYCLKINGNCLQNFKNLNKLIAEESNLKEEYLNYLNYTNLNELNISNCKHLKKFNYLQNFINLTNLNISYLSVTDNDLNNLQKLKYLTMDYCKDISGDCFKNFTKLKLLNAISTNFKENNLKYLQNSLQYLNVNLHDNMTGEFFPFLTNLITLQFTCKIKDDYLQTLQNLQSLNLSDCKEITGDCLKYLFNLTELNLTKTIVKDEHLKNLKELKILNLNNCKNIKGYCFNNLNKLEELHLNKNDQIKDEHLNHLILMKKLFIENCKLIEGKVIKNFKNLQELQFNDRHFANKSEIVKLQEKVTKKGTNLRTAIKYLDYENDMEYHSSDTDCYDSDDYYDNDDYCE
ncbi:hypothetical protein ABK040_010640 [Willaertia magna]